MKDSHYSTGMPRVKDKRTKLRIDAERRHNLARLLQCNRTCQTAMQCMPLTIEISTKAARIIPRYHNHQKALLQSQTGGGLISRKV